MGDIVGEWLVLALGLTIAGRALYADFLLDFALAWLLGVVFQYFTIVPMRMSIVAFQVGLFAGMYLYQQLIFPAHDCLMPRSAPPLRPGRDHLLDALLSASRALVAMAARSLADLDAAS